MNGFQALNVFLGSAAFVTALILTANSPNRVRNGKIAGVLLGICCLVTLGFLLSVS